MQMPEVEREAQIHQILASHRAEIMSLVEAVRKLVRDSVPVAEEAAYLGWHGIGYTHPAAGYFCAIFPRRNTVRLAFEFGVLLPDPASLLQGTGKQVRYVDLRPGNAIPVPAIQALIRAALDLPPGRDAKLALLPK